MVYRWTEKYIQTYERSNHDYSLHLNIKMSRIPIMNVYWPLGKSHVLNNVVSVLFAISSTSKWKCSGFVRWYKIDFTTVTNENVELYPAHTMAMCMSSHLTLKQTIFNCYGLNYWKVICFDDPSHSVRVVFIVNILKM